MYETPRIRFFRTYAVIRWLLTWVCRDADRAGGARMSPVVRQTQAEVEQRANICEATKIMRNHRRSRERLSD